MGKYIKLNLKSYFSNNGFTVDTSKQLGNFTGLGTSYLATELPNPYETVLIGDVPFLFPSKINGDFNNFEFENQKILFPYNNISTIHFLGASDNGSFLEEAIIYGGNFEEKVRIGLSNWVSEKPEYGELEAYRCNSIVSNSGTTLSFAPAIWYQKVNVSINYSEGVIFSDNPCIHIFSITLERR